MNRVEIERVVQAPRDTVFARYTDHAGWTDWARIGRVAVVTHGAGDPDGVGCVRSFSLFGLREEVVEFQRPQLMAYRIVRGGIPFSHHRALVTFEARGDATRVVWHTEFEPRLAILGRTIERVLHAVFSRVLARFAHHVERSA
jgi:uncharacterized protein YndB with AHSA1/START domain